MARYEKEENLNKLHITTIIVFAIVVIGFLSFLLYNSYNRGVFFQEIWINIMIIILIGIFLYRIPAFARERFKKQVKAVEIDGEELRVIKWSGEEDKIELKKIKEIAYYTIKQPKAAVIGELRIEADQKITIDFPELLKNYKEMYAELQSKTGLKMRKFREYNHLLWRNRRVEEKN